ncbi:hypothetical protein, partial [Belliella pelovolcani]|uniref:hypothetical protein n=1 Tax=Belliella pelovolcani TaxID=529505 RepID=UPI00391C6C2D
MMKKYFYFILFSLSILSCGTPQTNIEYYNKYEGQLIFDLDSLTPNYVNHMQLVTENGEKYLYLLSPYGNRFVVYNFHSGEYLTDIKFPNQELYSLKIGSYLNGFFVKSSDSIYMVSKTSKLLLGDNKGNLTEVYDFLKKFPEDRHKWLILSQFSKPFFLNDSILSFGGLVQNTDQIYREGLLTDINFNFSKIEPTYETIIPSGIYKPGNFYMPDRERPGRSFSMKYNKVYYSFPNADSIYVKDIKSNMVTSFCASLESIQPVIEIDNLPEFSDFISKQSMVYNSQQGAYNAIYCNDSRDLLIRVAYLGIKDYDPELHKQSKY